MSRKSSGVSSHVLPGKSGIIGDRESSSSRNDKQNTPSKERTVCSNRYDSYKVAIYGNSAEKEAHKQQVRAKLKEQVKEKNELHQKQLIERVAESDQAVALDQKSKVEDSQTRLKKAVYLKQFSDGNKKIMEEREKVLKSTKEAETQLERRLLDINPINWNMTLH